MPQPLRQVIQSGQLPLGRQGLNQPHCPVTTLSLQPWSMWALLTRPASAATAPTMMRQSGAVFFVGARAAATASTVTGPGGEGKSVLGTSHNRRWIRHWGKAAPPKLLRACWSGDLSPIQSLRRVGRIQDKPGAGLDFRFGSRALPGRLRFSCGTVVRCRSVPARTSCGSKLLLATTAARQGLLDRDGANHVPRHRADSPLGF